MARALLSCWLLATLLLALGCETTECEERCEEDWYDECVDCVENDPVLDESECAEIWCR